MANCRMCEERGQTWQGDSPKCAFVNGRRFTDNWNCATVGAIRDLVAQDDERDRPAGIWVRYCDDQWFAVIDVHYIDNDHDEMDRRIPGDALFVSWYKHRGRTDGMWFLGSCEPERPTEAQVLRVLEYYAANHPRPPTR